MRRLPLFSLALTLSVGCSPWDDGLPPADGGGADASASDAGHDAAVDASVTDSGVAPMDASHELDANFDAAASDASGDGETDAGHDAGSCSTVLLMGGTDVATQGWTTVTQPTATLSNGADYAHLETATASGAHSGGQLLLTHASAVPTNAPFRLEVVLQVESVAAHNTLDSAAAIMGAITGALGSSTERAEMIYLDSASIGWADDTQTAQASVVDGQKHTVLLAVDAQNVAHVSFDGVEKLTRNDYTTNGTIAIGDQSNDVNLESALRIYSVTLLCP